MEVRCPNKKHAELIDGQLEIKCSSRFCGAGKGTVVIHVYNLDDGKLLSTRRFREVVPRQEVKDGAC